MKLIKSITVVLLLVACGAIALAETTPPEGTKEVKWTDVTGEIKSNSGEGKGWLAEPTAKIFRDESGNQLKITSKFANLRIDLQTKKIFVVKDNAEKEAANGKIFKRTNLMIVIKTDVAKFLISLKEEVPGVTKHLVGLAPRD